MCCSGSKAKSSCNLGQWRASSVSKQVCCLSRSINLNSINRLLKADQTNTEKGRRKGGRGEGVEESLDPKQADLFESIVKQEHKDYIIKQQHRKFHELAIEKAKFKKSLHTKQTNLEDKMMKLEQANNEIQNLRKRKSKPRRRNPLDLVMGDQY